jgi:hypothetical protein
MGGRGAPPPEDFENDHHLATNLSSPQKILMYAMYLHNGFFNDAMKQGT